MNQERKQCLLVFLLSQEIWRIYGSLPLPTWISAAAPWHCLRAVCLAGSERVPGGAESPPGAIVLPADTLAARQVRQVARRGELFLPDCAGRLSVCSACIHASAGVQASRLLSRIDPRKVRPGCAHHRRPCHQPLPRSQRAATASVSSVCVRCSATVISTVPPGTSCTPNITSAASSMINCDGLV